MEQRDFLVRQAEQLGQVLGKMLARLLGLKSPEHISGGLEVMNLTFEEELGFGLDELLAIPTDNLINTLKIEKKFSNDNLERLADIFFYLAEGANSEESNQLNARSLAIYEYLDENDKTYSYDRQLKIENLKTV
jgi:hypothetical protein